MTGIIADVVGANVAGHRRATRLLERLRNGFEHPDALDAEILAISDPQERRGMLRCLQKVLELRAPPKASTEASEA